MIEPTLASEFRTAKAWGVEPWDIDEWFRMPRATRAMFLAFEAEQARANYWSMKWGAE